MCKKKKISPKRRQIALYQVLMAGPHPGTQPLRVAPPAPLPPGMFHSDEAALYQSNRCAALCAECPSKSCLEQKGSRVKDKAHTRTETWTSRAEIHTSRSCHSLVPTFKQLPQVQRCLLVLVGQPLNYTKKWKLKRDRTDVYFRKHH